MKFSEFIKKAKRTCPSYTINGRIIIDRNNPNLPLEVHPINNKVLDDVHMKLGLVSELDEIIEALTRKDRVNISEELGDVLWYAANDITFLGLESHLSDYVFLPKMAPTDGNYLGTVSNALGGLFSLVYNVAKLCDMTKKYLAYDKPINQEEVIKRYKYVLGAINNIAYGAGVDVEKAMDIVIEKLQKRYPEAFTVENAKERDTDTERKAMENTLEDQDQDPNSFQGEQPNNSPS